MSESLDGRDQRCASKDLSEKKLKGKKNRQIEKRKKKMKGADMNSALDICEVDASHPVMQDSRPAPYSMGTLYQPVGALMPRCWVTGDPLIKPRARHCAQRTLSGPGIGAIGHPAAASRRITVTHREGGALMVCRSVRSSTRLYSDYRTLSLRHACHCFIRCG